MAVNPVNPVEDTSNPSWVPTRKFATATIVTVVIYVISKFTDVDKDTEQLVNVLAPLVAAYLVPNKKTVAGKGL